MNKREFIISTLKPYLLNKNLCGYNVEYKTCQYLTDDGKMCAVGKWLDKSHPNYISVSQSNRSVTGLDSEYILNNLLKKEAKDILNIEEWYNIQCVHDSISTGGYNMIEKNLQKLEYISGTDLSELKELCENMKKL